ncbi:kinesin motor catalytic domain protein (macronuclear) [Tetrahymena thermophila SB210]|uniref:Kinesin motor catalytic domain protein n=1 Tax=Tetrahymena thermophila (strain SB210) TaxID=312017 RepID=Q24D89_TETTS|nr:kinesin motor catalytic domain protein [Tetrahymena thermophila SB210]EAS05756.2 kinesin motor catalytic domain protein [Tetrahymena thermophila SB210]|eukprot:XP_001026001.2 kinesin motor catalytic domain protein [Tetrahymena thermophila SB210]
MISADQQNYEEFIRVIVRKIPQIQTHNSNNNNNNNNNNEDQVCINQSENSISINYQFNQTLQKPTFHFDTIFDEKSTQQQIYNNAVSHLVDSLFQGVSSTIWAAGQTGSGKSYTLFGIKQDEGKKGIVYRAIDQIFSKIKNFNESNEEQKQQNEEYNAYISIYTLYQERLEDLLADKSENLRIKQIEDQIYIEKLTKMQITSVQECLDVLQNGINKNLTNITLCSLLQSRQFFFIEISVQQINKSSGIEQMSSLKIIEFEGYKNSISLQKQNEVLFHEKPYFSKTLAAFNNVIVALTNENSFHIPYRDSKLTRIMQDSLGGNSRGLMICNLNTKFGYEDILYNLRIASRVQQVRNRILLNKNSYNK